MTHDQEQRYHERQHAGWLSEQRQYGSYTDMDVLREIALEREEKERREKQATEEKKD